LASAWTCERETERDRERAREDKDGPRPRMGIRPRPRGDKGGRFFSLLIYGIGYTYQSIPKITSYLWYRLHLSADIKNGFQMS
jgi:hypothetical protein